MASRITTQDRAQRSIFLQTLLMLLVAGILLIIVFLWLFGRLLD